MITLDKMQTIEGVTVYGDDEVPDLFYPIPNEVRFRLHDDGKPVFSFFEYREMKESTGGNKEVDGGALCLFDVEFTLPPGLDGKIMDKLKAQTGKPVNLGRPTYLTGTAEIQHRQGANIKTIYNQGVPSLYGSMVTSFNAELTPNGANLFKSAFVNNTGIIQVVYKLKAPARCGKLSMEIEYESKQVYKFVQELKQQFPEVKDRNIIKSGEFQRKLSETLTKQQVGKVTIVDSSVGIGLDGAARTAYEQAKNDLQAWGLAVLKEQMAKNLEGLPPVSDQERADFEKAANEAQKNGFFNVGWFWIWCVVSPNAQKEVEKKNIQSFNLKFTKSAPIEWSINPQGTLPSVTTLPKKDGGKWAWNEFHKLVDPMDSSFRRFTWNMELTKPLGEAPLIHSVLMNVYHPGLDNGMMSHTFTAQNQATPFQVSAWASDSVGGRYAAAYDYSYKVNFKNRSPFESRRIQVDRIEPTYLGLYDLGVLELNVEPLDVQFSLDELVSLTVDLEYIDAEKGINFKPPAILFNTTNTTTRQIREPLLQRLDKPVRYKTTWNFGSARVLTGWEEFPLQNGRLNTLQLTDVMTSKHTKGVRGLGFGDTVEKIDYTLTYEDPAFKYVKKVRKTLEDESEQEVEIESPLPSEGAKFYYEAVIYLKEGQPKRIAKQAFGTDTLVISSVETEQMEIIIKSAAGLWREVEMIELSISHPASGASENFEFPKVGQELKDGLMELDKWVIPIPKGSSKKYNWEAVFTMKEDDDKRQAEKLQDVGKFLTLKVPAKA